MGQLDFADAPDPDRDPELDVTLSDGRRVVTFQIVAIDRDLGTWTAVETLQPRRLLWTHVEALAMRRQIDARIAARLASGWVPVESAAQGATAVAWPRDLAYDVGYLVEAVTRQRDVVRAIDPTGQLWAAVAILCREARRCGLAAVVTRQVRAQQERRLGVLAEASGDPAQAIAHYRRALALHRGVGVRRRLAWLERNRSGGARSNRCAPDRPGRGRARFRR